MLEVADLKISYGNIDAVQGISFQVAKNEIVSLIGSNGAGKTTTLKSISGLLKAKSGNITLDGESIIKNPGHDLVKKGLIHVPEGRQIFSKLSVMENLTLGGYHVRDKELFSERKEYVFDLFPILKERYRQPAGTLSGGEQQMLAIARALMAGPKMLLLDEPSLGLAPVIVQRVFEVIEQLRGLGITILLVEQNANEALHISDRAYLMESGRIVLTGLSRDLLNDENVRNAYLGGDLQ